MPPVGWQVRGDTAGLCGGDEDAAMTYTRRVKPQNTSNNISDHRVTPDQRHGLHCDSNYQSINQEMFKVA